MRRFRQMQTPGEIGLAAGDVENWGYPREVEEAELVECGWWRYGHDAVLWFANVPDIPMAGVLHLCVHPETRRKHLVGARRLFRGVDILADLFCLELLIANDCQEGGPVADYLRRLGWKRETLGGIEGEWMCKRFPPSGDSDGQSAEKAEVGPS